MKRRIGWIVMGILLLALSLTACGGLADQTPTGEPTRVGGAETAIPATDAPVTTDPTTEAATDAPTEDVAATEAPAEATTTSAPSLNELTIDVELVADGLNLPVGLANAEDGSGRLFVLEKAGVIRIIQDGVVQDGPFLDISDRVGSSGSEQGLLGLAFHPNYTENGFFFVDYTDRNGDTVVSRFSVTDDPSAADPASEEVVLTQNQPARNHNGGELAFGPDGYLYIGLGDGGGAGDTYGNGQNLQSWLGTLLRIDVDELPYSVPADNPFVGSADALDEIWAYGLRNPWRFSFDRATGDLYIADVGQNIYEEVDYQPAESTGGENYGWPILEGFHCFATANCDASGYVQPVAEYSHDLGCSITGGYVYRGQAYPALNGVYLYSDYCSGRVWGLVQSADGSWQSAQLLETNASVASFGEDEAGEVYFTDIAGGAVYRVTVR